MLRSCSGKRRSNKGFEGLNEDFKKWVESEKTASADWS